MSIKDTVSRLVSGVAKEAGASVAASPGVQAAVDKVRAELEDYKVQAYAAAGIALMVVVFYYVPRFENPLKLFRKTRR